MSQTAILRILIDLIKADAVIDSTEMEDFYRIHGKYHINNSHLRKAASMTLSEAIAELQGPECTQRERNELLNELQGMTVVDGFCVKKEALILTAMRYCLGRDTKTRSEIISVNVPNIAIAEDQVVYVESERNMRIHNEIQANYRQMNTEFKCAGLNFFYIPKVAEHYRETDPKLFKNVCRFLAPGFNEDEIDSMVSYISGVTTMKFCKDQLFGKLGISSVYNTMPGLMIHIGTSYVDNKLYNNFLKVEFTEGENVCKQILSFLDTYTKYLSYDVVVIPKADDAEGHFLYGGFYKFVYDLYLMKNRTDSPILLDFLRTSIFFPQVGRDFELNVSRREQALYLLILMETPNGGVCFTNTDDKKETEKRLADIKRKYSFIYTELGGDAHNLPDIFDNAIRNPSISHINKFFKNGEEIFTDNMKYTIKTRKVKGSTFYVAPFDWENILVRESFEGEPVLLLHSNALRRYNSLCK